MLDPSKLNTFKEGEILVTTMTDPAWEPIMKRASAIVTERGGRTCHSAIISRELGHSVHRRHRQRDRGDQDRHGSNGFVRRRRAAETFITARSISRSKKHEITDNERPETQVMMNVGDPDHAFAVSRLPNDGVGLARLEFIINNHIGIHPMALVNYPNLRKQADIDVIAGRILEEDPKEFFVRSLAGRYRPYRRGVLSEAGDRQNVGFQIERIRDAYRRKGVRADRGKSDDRFSRCVPLLRRPVQSRISGWNVWLWSRVREDMGLTNVKADDPFLPYGRRRRKGRSR